MHSRTSSRSLAAGIASSSTEVPVHFLAARIGLLGGTVRQVPLVSLLAGNGRSFEMDLDIRSITPELGLDIAGSINAARVEVAEMIDVGGLAVGLERLAVEWRKLIEL